MAGIGFRSVAGVGVHWPGTLALGTTPSEHAGDLTLDDVYGNVVVFPLTHSLPPDLVTTTMASSEAFCQHADGVDPE